jgi:hypothetical protein
VQDSKLSGSEFPESSLQFDQQIVNFVTVVTKCCNKNNTKSQIEERKFLFSQCLDFKGYIHS